MRRSSLRWLPLAALSLSAVTLHAQDSLAWEPVGDRPIKPLDIAFSDDGALWSSAAAVMWLSDPDDPTAVWELRRDWRYDAILPLGTDTVLVTTGYQTDRSTDGGYTFTQVHNGGWREEGGQTLAEDEHGRLYVATQDGAARSLDRGDSWTDAEFGGPQPVHRGWAVLPLPDPLAAGRVLVGGLGGVSAAADADADWTLYPTALWEGIRYGIESLVLVEGPAGAPRVVAVGADQTLPHQRVWVSDDLGETWAARGPLPDVPDGGVGTGGLAAAFALGGRSAVAVLGRGNVYLTDDGAETWSLVGRAPVDTSIVHAKGATVGPDGRLYVGISRIGPDYERAWVYRTAEPLTLPSVTVTAASAGGLITVPPEGGAFTFRVTLTNPAGEAQTVPAGTAVCLPDGTAHGPLLLREVTVPAGSSVTATLRQRVPASAPPGVYRYVAFTGGWPDGLGASDEFAFHKSAGGAVRGVAGAAAWSAEVVSLNGGAAQGEEAAAADAEAARLSVSVSPNPLRGKAALTLDLPEAGAVSAVLYDAVGRRVAVLHEGPLGAGRHRLTLDGSDLAPGVYVVRAEVRTSGGASRVAVRRLVVAR